MVMKEIKEEPEQRIKKWLEQIQTFHSPIAKDQIKLLGETEKGAQIRDAAYYIALKHPSFDELCWSLAEKIQIKYNSKPSIEAVREIAEKIYHSTKTYDELCWLNAEIEILDKK
jgi:hypothetical protein